MPFLHAPGDNLLHIQVGYRMHADAVLKHYAPDKNQAIHCMILCHTVCQMTLELRHLTTQVPQWLEELLTLVDRAYHKLMPHLTGYLACIIALFGNQPILCQRRTCRISSYRILV